jgi:hypothetical protein
MSRPMKRRDFRLLTDGVQIGALRLFFARKNWKTKTHPYWFARNWDTTWTVQSGPFEIWYHKKRMR